MLSDGTNQIGAMAAMGTSPGAVYALPTEASLVVGTTQVSTSAPVPANPIPLATSTYAYTSYDLAATAATNVKNGAGNVYGWYAYNPNATGCFLQFYNSTSATLGTNALHPFFIAATSPGGIVPTSIALFNLGTGISTGQTTTSTGATPCSTAMPVTIFYQ
jgi:hypothetical protein